MNNKLSKRAKRNTYIFIVIAVAFVISLPLSFYSCPAYDIAPRFSFLLLLLHWCFFSVAFLLCSLLVLGSIKICRKYHPLFFCRCQIKEIATMLYTDKGKHLCLHLLLIIGSVTMQLVINWVSRFLHSTTWHFSLAPEFRMLDTIVCYLFMLLLTYLYLKITRCNTRTTVYCAVVGIFSCVITALGLEWGELCGYEAEFCSDIP